MGTFTGAAQSWAPRVVGAAVLAASVNAVFWVLMRAALGPEAPNPTWFSFFCMMFAAVVAWPTFVRTWTSQDRNQDRPQLTKLVAGCVLLALCLLLVNRLIQPDQVVGGVLFLVVILTVSIKWVSGASVQSWLGSGRLPEPPPGPPIIIKGRH